MHIGRVVHPGNRTVNALKVYTMGFKLFLLAGLVAAVVAAPPNGGGKKGEEYGPEMKGKQNNLTAGDIHVQISEKAGRMKIWREVEKADKGGDSDNDTDADMDHRRTKPLFILIDELMERDAQGNEVGKGGQQKHSFKSFATQDFEFSNIEEDRTIPNSDAVKATSISYAGQLSGLTSKLNTTIYIAKSSGTVTLGNVENVTESYAISKGEVKFTVELMDWAFCGQNEVDCGQNEVGEYVDFTLSLKIPPGRKIKRKEGKKPKGKPETFELGVANSNIKMSQLIRVDDVWENMPEGYPKYEVKGANHMFTIRFPKHTNSAFYDPAVTVDQVDDGSNATGGATTLVTSIVTMAAALMFGAKLV